MNRVAVCYPTDSLLLQVAGWSQQKMHDTGTRVVIEPCVARSQIGIRRAVHGSDFVLVDATNDYAQAVEAFSQAAAQVGSKRVAVYSEEMHEGLELFVRQRGSWVLLGPLGLEDWDGLFAPHMPDEESDPMLNSIPMFDRASTTYARPNERRRAA
jgi:hypothetical protein